MVLVWRLQTVLQRTVLLVYLLNLQKEELKPLHGLSGLRSSFSIRAEQTTASSDTFHYCYLIIMYCEFLTKMFFLQLLVNSLDALDSFFTVIQLL